MKKQAARHFILSPTVTLIDVLAEYRIPESQVFLFFFLTRVQERRLIGILFWILFFCLVFQKIHIDVLQFHYSVSLCGFVFIFFSQ